MTEPMIVTFANAAYIPVVRNWLAAIDAAGVRAPVRIIALDAATRDALLEAIKDITLAEGTLTYTYERGVRR